MFSRLQISFSVLAFAIYAFNAPKIHAGNPKLTSMNCKSTGPLKTSNGRTLEVTLLELNPPDPDHSRDLVEIEYTRKIKGHESKEKVQFPKVTQSFDSDGYRLFESISYGPSFWLTHLFPGPDEHTDRDVHLELKLSGEEYEGTLECNEIVFQ